MPSLITRHGARKKMRLKRVVKRLLQILQRYSKPPSPDLRPYGQLSCFGRFCRNPIPYKRQWNEDSSLIEWKLIYNGRICQACGRNQACRRTKNILGRRCWYALYMGHAKHGQQQVSLMTTAFIHITVAFVCRPDPSNKWIQCVTPAP